MKLKGFFWVLVVMLSFVAVLKVSSRVVETLTHDPYDESNLKYWQITITRADGTVRWNRIAESDREPDVRVTESGKCQLISWRRSKGRMALLVEPGDTYAIRFLGTDPPKEQSGP